MTEQPTAAPRKPTNKRPPPEDTSKPDIYVVRSPAPNSRFGWEIRRMGAIVLERSREDFATADAARENSRAALEALCNVSAHHAFTLP